MKRENLADRKLTLEQTVAALDNTKNVLLRTNERLQDENRTLDSKISISTDTLEKLRGGIETQTGKFSDISIQKQKLEEDFSVLQAGYDALHASFMELEQKNKTETQQYEEDIAKLEVKQQQLVQSVMQQQQEDEALRKQLATWAKQLDERDKNLRIRESEVDERERYVVRNYNLLNL